MLNKILIAIFVILALAAAGFFVCQYWPKGQPAYTAIRLTTRPAISLNLVQISVGAVI